MSTKNTVGYCPYCKQNVLMVKEAVNWALVIILLIFTGGIGLIIYGIIYYNKIPSRCIHCKSQIALTSASSVQSSNQIQSNKRLGQENGINAFESVDVDKTQKTHFCSFCGEPLLNREAMFCAHCGSKV